MYRMATVKVKVLSQMVPRKNAYHCYALTECNEPAEIYSGTDRGAQLTDFVVVAKAHVKSGTRHENVVISCTESTKVISITNCHKLLLYVVV